MARMVMPGPSLSQITQDIYDINKEKGWHEGGRTVSDYVALIITELAEAVEEFRTGHDFNDIHYTVKVSPDRPMSDDPLVVQGLRKLMHYQETRGDAGPPTEAEWEALVHAGIAKPEGVVVEFIDALIRLLDTLGAENANVQKVLDLKMAYNRTRPHRHGGKRL